MRVGATVLFHKGYCYQSYKWQYCRPLGSLQTVINGLESYLIDEIAIIRPVRQTDYEEDLQRDLNELQLLDSMTPLSLGGGLRKIHDIKRLSTLPIERFAISSAFLSADEIFLEQMNAQFGRQAIQAVLPFRKIKEGFEIYHSERDDYIPLKRLNTKVLRIYANEIILYDTQHEGKANTFEDEIADVLGISTDRLICSGGIGTRSIEAMRKKGYAAALIENRILHKEYSKKRYYHG